jgi:integrase
VTSRNKAEHLRKLRMHRADLFARLAGLEGDFGAHSLRSGFVTEAGRQNVPMKEAMQLTGHRSLATFLRYFQSGAVQLSAAAADLLKNSR